MDDWGEAWELPKYPKLPKLFTSAKTAKKRKHKEYIVTDELLEQPVKLPKQGDTGIKASKQQQGQQTELPSPKDGADKANARIKKHKEHQSNKAKDERVAEPMAAAPQSEHIAATNKKQKEQRKKNKSADIHQADTPLQQAGQQQQRHEEIAQPPLDGTTRIAAAAPHVNNKGKKRKKQDTAATEPLAPATAAAGAAADAQGSTAPKPPKKSKNKFKQPEFLERQQRQLQQSRSSKQAKLQQPNKIEQAGEQQLQVAPVEPSAVGAATNGASKKDQDSKQKSRTSAASAAAGTAASTLQQQQVALAAASKSARKQKTPASSIAVAAAAAPASKQKTPAGGSGGSNQKSLAGCSGGSKLLQQFKERLQGSRFRQLNEALYTQPGDESFAMLQEQPELFKQYHEGFQQQVKSWPAQPLDAAIAWLAGKPEATVVADFGCGDARLAATVRQQVHSLDLVAHAPGVIACNMAHTPLDSGSCDVAVFSLALMGVDYGEFLVEAARVVKQGGWLWIAEIRSRFTGSSGSEDFRPFLNCLQQLGFRLVKQDARNKMFVVFVLKKQRQVAAAAADSINWPLLKACVYKKR